MGIKYITGDIFKSKCFLLIITVNCVGVMGAGIAKICKQLFPATYRQYRQKCQAGQYKPGQPIMTTVDRPLLLFPTKNHWRNGSEYAWIEEGLKRIAKNSDKWESIAIPPLGCGHGGLEWSRVKGLIEKHLGHIKDKTIEVYEPKRQGKWKSRTLRHDAQMIHTEIYYE